MKKLLTLIFGIAVLAMFSGLANAEPTTVKGGKSNSDYRVTTVRSGKSNSDGITGKVSQVGNGTFTLTAKGKAYKFVLPKMGPLPKVGEVVDVTYTGTLGGSEPAQAKTVHSGKSNSDN